MFPRLWLVLFNREYLLPLAINTHNLSIEPVGSIVWIVINFINLIGKTLKSRNIGYLYSWEGSRVSQDFLPTNPKAAAPPHQAQAVLREKSTWKQKLNLKYKKRWHPHLIKTVKIKTVVIFFSSYKVYSIFGINRLLCCYHPLKLIII